MEAKNFNIRVYGLLIDENKVLITDEMRHSSYMTKFPGGGLQLGEGTIDCLKREFMEELEQEIISVEHFYTTDFFQATRLLNPIQQLISIYYLVQMQKPYRFAVKSKQYDFDERMDGPQDFRWINLDDLEEDHFTFPIDKKVAMMLKEKYSDGKK